MFQKNYKINIKGFNKSFLSDKENNHNYTHNENGNKTIFQNNRKSNNNLLHPTKKSKILYLNNSYINYPYLKAKNIQNKQNIIANKSNKNYIILDRATNKNENNIFKKGAYYKNSKKMETVMIIKIIH